MSRLLNRFSTLYSEPYPEEPSHHHKAVIEGLGRLTLRHYMTFTFNEPDLTSSYGKISPIVQNRIVVYLIMTKTVFYVDVEEDHESG
jgi:hypothetical protein